MRWFDITIKRSCAFGSLCLTGEKYIYMSVVKVPPLDTIRQNVFTYVWRWEAVNHRAYLPGGGE